MPHSASSELKENHFASYPGEFKARSLNLTSTKAMHKVVNTCSTMSARALLRFSSSGGCGQRKKGLAAPTALRQEHRRLDTKEPAAQHSLQPHAEYQLYLHSPSQPCAKIQVANNVLLSIFNIPESIYGETQLLCKAEIECSAHHSMFCHMVYRMAYQIILYVDPIFKAGIVSNFLAVISGLKILHERKQRLYNVI